MTLRRLNEKYRDLWLAFALAIDPEQKAELAKRAGRVYRQIVRRRR